MMKRSVKRKLLQARIKLNQTIHQILEINRKRKKLPYYRDTAAASENIQEELKVLNKIAANQAQLIDRYETALAKAN